jgi:hypothetical protein
MKRFDVITLGTPKAVEVTNYGKTSTVELTECKVGAIRMRPSGAIIAQLIDFPENSVTLWEDEEGSEKQEKGFTREDALARAVEVIK